VRLLLFHAFLGDELLNYFLGRDLVELVNDRAYPLELFVWYASGLNNDIEDSTVVDEDLELLSKERQDFINHRQHLSVVDRAFVAADIKV